MKTKMKVFVCNSKDKFCSPDSKEYNWTEQDEILFLGLFRYNHHVGLSGLQTTKGTTCITVKELDIKIDYILELAEEAYKKGGHTTNENHTVSLNMGFDEDIILNYKENLEMTLKEAGKFEVGDSIKVEGFVFSKI